MSEKIKMGDDHGDNNIASTDDSEVSMTSYIPWSEVMMDIRESGQYPFNELVTITKTRREILLSVMLGECHALTFRAGAKLLSIHQLLFPGKFA